VTLASKGSATSSLPFFYHSISPLPTTHAPIFYRDIESRPSLTSSTPILNAVYYEKAEFMSIENLKTFGKFATFPSWARIGLHPPLISTAMITMYADETCVFHHM
jgi:hypothetical protein